MPNQPWLLALVGRKGWHHLMLRENGKIVEVRSHFLKDGMVWIGIDAPIPGILTPDFEADYFLVHAMLEHAAAPGGIHFLADIEKTGDEESLPSYKYFSELGFSVSYRRQIFCKHLI